MREWKKSLNILDTHRLHVCTALALKQRPQSAMMHLCNGPLYLLSLWMSLLKPVFDHWVIFVHFLEPQRPYSSWCIHVYELNASEVSWSLAHGRNGSKLRSPGTLAHAKPGTGRWHQDGSQTQSWHWLDFSKEKQGKRCTNVTNVNVIFSA